MTVRRVACVIRLEDGMEHEYRRLRAVVRPEVLAALRRAHVSDCSIVLRDGMLYGYLEHTDGGCESDLRAIATATADQWRAPAEEVFHR